MPLAARPVPVTIGQSFLTGSLDASAGPAGWALASHGVADDLADSVVEWTGRT